MTTTADTLRVQDILALDALGTCLLAGRDGVRRPILWAHSCELAHPEHWLGRDELLMTVGACIPADADRQVELIRRLDDAGLAGMAIGDDKVAPPLSRAMLAEADARGFPVLLTSKDVPFVALGRMVAAANAESQTQQVLTLSRLYQALLETGDGPEDFLTSLGDVFQVSLSAVDVTTGVVLLPGALHVSPEDMLEVRRGARAPAGANMARVGTVPGRDVSIWQIPARRQTLLFIQESGGRLLDSFTGVHLSQAVSVEADRRAAARLSRASRAREILASVFAGGYNPHALDADAEGVGLRTDRLRILVSRPAEVSTVTEALSLAGIVHASVERNSYLVVCVAEGDLEAVLALTGRLGVRVGISRTAGGLAEVGDAALNAQWALESVTSGETLAVEYDDVVFSVLPRSAGEAHEIVREVLGPLLRRDGSSAPLVETLCVFLDQDRNWASTARELGIHRQSLAYRLRRIEELTGRSLRSTRDLAELWIARMALNHSSGQG